MDKFVIYLSVCQKGKRNKSFLKIMSAEVVPCTSFTNVRNNIRQFVNERAWNKFHTPKVKLFHFIIRILTLKITLTLTLSVVYFYS